MTGCPSGFLGHPHTGRWKERYTVYYHITSTCGYVTTGNQVSNQCLCSQGKGFSHDFRHTQIYVSTIFRQKLSTNVLYGMFSLYHSTHPINQHSPTKCLAILPWVGPSLWFSSQILHPLSWSQAFLDLFRQEGTGEMAVLTGIVQHEGDWNGGITWARKKGAAPDFVGFLMDLDGLLWFLTVLDVFFFMLRFGIFVGWLWMDPSWGWWDINGLWSSFWGRGGKHGLLTGFKIGLNHLFMEYSPSKGIMQTLVWDIHRIKNGL